MALKYFGPGFAFLSCALPVTPNNARVAAAQSGWSGLRRHGAALGGTGAGSTSSSPANPGCAWWSKILIRSICGSRRW
jgi:hypothetical protein